jgi:hypothetical protein
MFTTSHPFLLFDHFRVPYDVDQDLLPDAGLLQVADRWSVLAPSTPGSPSLSWPLLSESPGVDGPSRMHRFRIGPLLLHGRLLADELLAQALAASPKGWRRADVLCDEDGRPLGAVWCAVDGSIVTPFDPDEVVTTFWSERYAEVDGLSSRRVRSAAMAAYYGVRPLLPRRLQIGMRRLYSRVQAKTACPRWPVEDSLHAFLDTVLGWAGSLAGGPVPWIAPWPSGRTWALVLTHDVETMEGVRRMSVLRDLEASRGYRSSWNFVPGRYSVDDGLVAELQYQGFEVGLHGLYHDGRDLEPSELPRRLPEMRRYAERWGAVGFRSPATHREWETMATLPFDYDSSSPDTDPYEPQPGGCCSWFPFYNRSLVELPITLPQDHTLFVILRARNGQAWIDKAERIRSRGGMALLITHPDYVDQGPIAAAYEQLLAHFEQDEQVWRALPGDVARWWRRRAASRIEPDGSSWHIVGAAAGEASISWAGPNAPGVRGPGSGPDTSHDG